MKKMPIISMLILSVLLLGCSTGKLAMNHAEDTAKAGNEAVKVSREYNNKLLALQREWVAMILATQPNCRLNSDWTITVRVHEGNNSNAPLCANHLDENQHNITKIHLMPLDEESFSRDEQILSAFSDYLAALTAYTSDTTYSVDELVDKALASASSINSKTDLSDGQKKAISGLVGFLQRLATEEKNKRNIETLIKDEGPKQTDNLKLVLEHIQYKKKLYDNTMRSDILNFSRLNFNQRSHTPPQPSQVSQSYDIASKMINLQYQTEKIINEPTAAEQTIKLYQEYNNGLISIIKNDITDKKIKKEQLSIQRANLKEGLGYIKYFVKDFAPLLIAAM